MLDWQGWVQHFIDTPQTTDNDASYTAKIQRTDASGLIARCIGVHLLEPGENTFDHHVLMALVDRGGRSIRNARADWGWYGMQASEKPQPVVLEKHQPEPPGNLPMWKTYQSVFVSIKDALGVVIAGSDIVYDLTTWFVYGEPADAGNLYHRSFLVVWQLMDSAPVVEPEPDEPPVVVPEPVDVSHIRDAAVTIRAEMQTLAARADELADWLQHDVIDELEDK